MNELARYSRVFWTFARNSLVRDMTFRGNFILEALGSVGWVAMNLGFYLLLFQYTVSIGGWSKFQFLAFVATTMMVNSLVQTFCMPNIEEFSELIRTGGLDFALLKPIDTQFLVSFRRVEWSDLSTFIMGLVLLIFSLAQLDFVPPLHQIVLFPVFILCGAAILYSLMIALASTSIWLGRNQSLYDFWFYITIFSRYPMEIYSGKFGLPLQIVCTYIIPILLVVNVPARLVAKEMTDHSWWLAGYAVFAAAVSVWTSRWLFRGALGSYRSASS